MKCFFCFILILLFTINLVKVEAEENSFEIPAVDQAVEKLGLSGNLDVKYYLFSSRKDALTYKLKYYDADYSSSLSSYKFDLYLNGDYSIGKFDMHIKTYSEYYNKEESSFELFEMYGNMNFSMKTSVQTGKKMFSWGKGYSFNPAGFLNPPKDPENPELAKEGVNAISIEYIKSFNSRKLDNMAFTFAILPSNNTLSNNKLSETKNNEIAAKLYLLYMNADIDFMWYYSNSGSRKIGADFSKNLVDNLELHGEYCYSDNLSRTAVFNNLLTSKTVNGQSYLIGFRWLNSLNTTIIGEYYYNDNGLSKEEYNNYLGYMESVENSANTSAIRTALNISQNYFSDNNLMKKYFYIKAIQPEPFNWLYFTPSVYFIYSIEDESFMNGVNLLYKPFTNLEFQFTSILTVGSRDSQFGTKENKNKLEILSRFYF